MTAHPIMLTHPIQTNPNDVSNAAVRSAGAEVN
jgi:hypothetical protein